MNIGILLGIIAFAGISIILFGVLRARRADAVIGERLTQFAESTASISDQELEVPFTQRVLVPLFQSALVLIGKYGPKQSQDRLRINLMLAGNPGGVTPVMFIGLRVMLMLVIGGLVTAVVFQSVPDTTNRLLYSGVGIAIGYMLPVMWLGRKITARQKAIVKALPDAIDLLTISVEAGLAFDLALQRVSKKWDNELSNEFKKALSDVQLGKTRREALKDLAIRTGVEDVQTFTAAVIQADQLGVSLSKILRLQSDQMRMRRRQRAEEAAQKAPVKMLFPLVFLIFPALFVVILGPAVPRIMDSFGGL